ncbi:unnamed protein product [Euphydryas editha]|uniref:Uncharacterized protein n=1 Tax=Euphydryas editha TaxID=104508 RepID=A0AAU9T9U1_EUPED|nr:unnamed protein product [Euphydryas editha]
MAIKTEIISEHKPDWETVVEDLWDKHLILGDFNLGDIDWDNLTGLPQNLLDAKSAALSEFMTSTNLSQLNYSLNSFVRAIKDPNNLYVLANNMD